MGRLRKRNDLEAQSLDILYVQELPAQRGPSVVARMHFVRCALRVLGLWRTQHLRYHI